MSSGSVFVYDTFTDTGNTNLLSHVGEIGASWSDHPQASTTAIISPAGDTARVGGVGNNYNYASGIPATADYDVEADVYIKGVSYNNTGVMARLDPVAWENYALRIVTSTGTNRISQLLKQFGGAETILSEDDANFPDESIHNIRLQLRGSSIKGYHDGTLIHDVVDSDITSVGRVAVRFRANNSSAASTTTNAELVYIRAIDAGPDEPSNPTTGQTWPRYVRGTAASGGQLYPRYN